MLIVLALILVGVSLWVHLGNGERDYSPPALTTSELATLPADLTGDMRLITELRRQVGQEPGDWQALPEAGKPLYATLWAEEIHRTQTWPQFAVFGVTDGTPTLDEVAAAYNTLGLNSIATSVQVLARQFDQYRPVLQEWMKNRKTNRALPPLSDKSINAAATAAFANLDACRVKRLEYVRLHANALGIR